MPDNDEPVVTFSKRHWVCLSGPVLSAFVIGVLAGVVAFLVPDPVRGAPWFGRVLGGVGAGLWLLLSGSAFFQWASTIYVITTKRILMRRGFLRRRIIEVSLDRVARCSISQGILGRVLRFGTVRVELSNGSWWTMRRLSRPQALVEGIGRAGRIGSGDTARNR